MINCYLLNGSVYHKGINFNEFKHIYSSLQDNLRLLNSIPSQAIILILDEFSKRIRKNRELLKVEGVSYLSLYLKKSNIEKLIEINLGNKEYLDKFIYRENGKLIKAQGRGIACHWIAGNVYTLALYSVFQAIIAKSSNILRVPEKSIDIVIKLLEQLDNIEITYKNIIYSSKDILKNICLIYFDSSDEKLNENMSAIADSRIIWGGEAAVKHITVLPKKTTCKDIIFGPKYSFSVFDKGIIEGEQCDKYINRLILDIITFGQNSCSSPQMLFIEKSNISIKDISKRIEDAFKRVGKRYKNVVDEATAAKIINHRGIYGLSLDKDLLCSKGLDYTILINKNIALEEPVGGRCIFVKEIDSIFDIKDLITRRIQTIGYAIGDKDKTLKFSESVTAAGVDRVVNVGSMNNYDSPWDGCFMINELVRWCCLIVED
ncbi:acyl-CoA reductase [Clostridium arbusti]|uniref:acyl-CoA reductase n=1 Tax=Clostridium arbusti TaxID=1137848 RepID=UPI000287D8B4|nr:acyl-CoA reductase [Clostridium arbusti]